MGIYVPSGNKTWQCKIPYEWRFIFHCHAWLGEGADSDNHWSLRSVSGRQENEDQWGAVSQLGHQGASIGDSSGPREVWSAFVMQKYPVRNRWLMMWIVWMAVHGPMANHHVFDNTDKVCSPLCESKGTRRISKKSRDCSQSSITYRVGIAVNWIIWYTHVLHYSQLSCTYTHTHIYI